MGKLEFNLTAGHVKINGGDMQENEMHTYVVLLYWNLCSFLSSCKF